VTDKKTLAGLVIIICFQVVILLCVYLNAVTPLWSGREIKLATVPVDPRSLFRGNYARLRYHISDIPAADINRVVSPRHGEKIYVKLKPGKDSTWAYAGVDIQKPDGPLFIRGRIQAHHRRESGHYRVRYGIEAFFAPKQKALDLEKTLRQTGVATVYVTAGGKAALSHVGSE
jgi:uncharacterized membrane-anchored protein